MQFLAALLVVLLGVLPASAQVVPSEAELRAYGGLHAAAARGDIADIEARIAAGENKEAVDARRRTPLHVAVYQKQHDAARALMRLGADPNNSTSTAMTSSPSPRSPTTCRCLRSRLKAAAIRKRSPAFMTARR